MHSNLAILQALDLPLFIPREQEQPMPQHDFIVIVEESEAEFSAAHQEQLQKIMAYLKQTDFVLLFAHSDFNCKAQTLLHFGTLQGLPQAHQIVTTQSISKMLTDPACKKQVLHDLQSLKSS
jgi:hypothetical protein